MNTQPLPQVAEVTSALGAHNSYFIAHTSLFVTYLASTVVGSCRLQLIAEREWGLKFCPVTRTDLVVGCSEKPMRCNTIRYNMIPDGIAYLHALKS